MRRAVLVGVVVLGVAVVGTVVTMRAFRRDGSGAIPRDRFPVLSGPYLGQPLPGTDPVRFAPGIVSTATLDGPPAFSADGREVYWTRLGPGGDLLESHLRDGRWTYPEPVPFVAPGARDFSPCLFDRGRRLFFLSTRPLPDGRRPQRGFFTFWTATREAEGWKTPSAVNTLFTGSDDFSTIADDGTLYVARAGGKTPIERVAWKDGAYLPPEPLSPAIHGFPTLVGPDQRYLVVSADLPGGYGARDLYVLFRKADGTWDAPVNLGPRVNSPAIEAMASMTPDGKYLFVASERGGNFDVYWLETSGLAIAAPPQ